MCKECKGGFSLIEMLTVIAIMAILAAVIFPVMGTARKKARQTECISNLYQIGVAMKLFFNDEARYPEFIAGPVDESNPQPLEETTGQLAGRSIALYPEYIKSVSGLKCPLVQLNGEHINYKTTATGDDIVDDPMYDYLQGLGVNSLRADTQYKLYKFSSYDYQVPPGLAPDTTYNGEAHYSTTWLASDAASKADPNYVRQLKWRCPPEDTVITWCSYHRDIDGTGTPQHGSKDLVLFLDGHVKLTDSRSMFTWTDGWKVPQGR
jgi:prepilin-type N-terminal cleavage/methylation domain-containing protein